MNSMPKILLVVCICHGLFAVSAMVDVTVSLSVDENPGESSWNLLDTVTSSPYFTEWQTFESPWETTVASLTLPSNEQWILVLLDTRGDGGVSGVIADGSTGTSLAVVLPDVYDSLNVTFVTALPLRNVSVTTWRDFYSDGLWNLLNHEGDGEETYWLSEWQDVTSDRVTVVPLELPVGNYTLALFGSLLGGYVDDPTTGGVLLYASYGAYNGSEMLQFAVESDPSHNSFSAYTRDILFTFHSDYNAATESTWNLFLPITDDCCRFFDTAQSLPAGKDTSLVVSLPFGEWQVVMWDTMGDGGVTTVAEDVLSGETVLSETGDVSFWEISFGFRVDQYFESPSFDVSFSIEAAYPNTTSYNLYHVSTTGGTQCCYYYWPTPRSLHKTKSETVLGLGAGSWEIVFFGDEISEGRTESVSVNVTDISSGHLLLTMTSQTVSSGPRGDFVVGSEYADDFVPVTVAFKFSAPLRFTIFPQDSASTLSNATTSNATEWFTPIVTAPYVLQRNLSWGSWGLYFEEAVYEDGLVFLSEEGQTLCLFALGTQLPCNFTIDPKWEENEATAPQIMLTADETVSPGSVRVSVFADIFYYEIFWSLSLLDSSTGFYTEMYFGSVLHANEVAEENFLLDDGVWKLVTSDSAADGGWSLIIEESVSGDVVANVSAMGKSGNQVQYFKAGNVTDEEYNAATTLDSIDITVEVDCDVWYEEFWGVISSRVSLNVLASFRVSQPYGQSFTFSFPSGLYQMVVSDSSSDGGCGGRITEHRTSDIIATWTSSEYKSSLNVDFVIGGYAGLPVFALFDTDSSFAETTWSLFNVTGGLVVVDSEDFSFEGEQLVALSLDPADYVLSVYDTFGDGGLSG
eukprot:Rmarinus@m.2512